MKQKEENQEAREIEIEDGEQTATESNQEQTESTEQKAEDEQPTADDNSIESQLAKALEEIAELKDKNLRQIAEFDNYRKRVIKEKAELILNGGEKVLTAILPTIDDLERAQNGMDKMTDVDAIKEGVNLIIDKFTKFLKAQGVEAIDTKDKDFDVNYHEAITMIPAPTPEMKGKVIDCTTKGYTLNGKVIRYSQVVVGE